MNVVANYAEELDMREVEKQTGDFCVNAISEVHLHMEKAKYKYKLQLIVECRQMFGLIHSVAEKKQLQNLITKYRKKISELDSKIMKSQLSKGEIAARMLFLNFNKEKYNEMITTLEECIEFETTPFTLEQIKSAYNLTEKVDERLECIL